VTVTVLPRPLTVETLVDVITFVIVPAGLVIVAVRVTVFARPVIVTVLAPAVIV